MSRSSGSIRSAAAGQLAVVLASVLVLWFVAGARHTDLTVPLQYGSDALAAQMQIKGTVENGWYLRNPALGFPGELDMSAYPQAEGLHFLSIKLLSALTRDSGQLMNLYFLVGFPLAAYFAYLALRQLGISFAAAAAAALLFAFQPYHFIRGEIHLFLSAYFIVPLIVLVACWIGEGTRAPLPSPRTRLVVGMLVCFAVGSAGVYYAFFACFLFLVAAAVAGVTQRTAKPLVHAMVHVAAVVVAVAVNLLPSLALLGKRGAPALAAVRNPGEAVRYGLQLIQLLSPLSTHRGAAGWTQLAQRYEATSPLVNENTAAALGIVASTGFVLLWYGLLYRPIFHGGLRLLPVFNAHLFLLATVGGVGALVAYAGVSLIRSYNRVSIFIAFLSLAAIASLGDRWWLSRRHGWPRWAALAVIALVTCFGLWDQTAPTYRLYRWTYGFDNRDVASAYGRDAAFVRQIEASLPAHGAIYQLPYRRFPEEPPTHRLDDYDGFIPYLHSRTLRWSYGAIKGSAADAWNQCVSGLAAQDLVDELRAHGFTGILVHTAGYADSGEAAVADLEQHAGGAILRDTDRMMVFIPLSPSPGSRGGRCRYTEG